MRAGGAESLTGARPRDAVDVEIADAVRSEQLVEFGLLALDVDTAASSRACASMGGRVCPSMSLSSLPAQMSIKPPAGTTSSWPFSNHSALRSATSLAIATASSVVSASARTTQSGAKTSSGGSVVVVVEVLVVVEEVVVAGSVVVVVVETGGVDGTSASGVAVGGAGEPMVASLRLEATPSPTDWVVAVQAGRDATRPHRSRSVGAVERQAVCTTRRRNISLAARRQGASRVL